MLSFLGFGGENVADGRAWLLRWCCFGCGGGCLASFSGCMAVAVAVIVIVRMAPIAPPLLLALCVFTALPMIPFRRM